MDQGDPAAPSSAGGDRPSMLRAGLSISGLSLDELQLACLALSDRLDRQDLYAALVGELTLTDHQYDVVAQALNDRLIDMGLDHLVPSASETRRGENG